ncbi:hypothetical protein [Agaribacterium haliotis]|uniref:hypothetical protein n=1 Tax=Agaribacterium haliotis TaxID=2013869 RepID=UPI0011781E05|nr:hypothetical protein [Agaribacterium haliotis]
MAADKKEPSAEREPSAEKEPSAERGPSAKKEPSTEIEGKRKTKKRGESPLNTARGLEEWELKPLALS